MRNQLRHAITRVQKEPKDQKTTIKKDTADDAASNNESQAKAKNPNDDEVD